MGSLSELEDCLFGFEDDEILGWPLEFLLLDDYFLNESSSANVTAMNSLFCAEFKLGSELLNIGSGLPEGFILGLRDNSWGDR